MIWTTEVISEEQLKSHMLTWVGKHVCYICIQLPLPIVRSHTMHVGVITAIKIMSGITAVPSPTINYHPTRWPSGELWSGQKESNPLMVVYAVG